MCSCSALANSCVFCFCNVSDVFSACVWLSVCLCVFSLFLLVRQQLSSAQLCFGDFAMRHEQQNNMCIVFGECVVCNGNVQRFAHCAAVAVINAEKAPTRKNVEHTWNTTHYTCTQMYLSLRMKQHAQTRRHNLEIYGERHQSNHRAVQMSAVTCCASSCIVPLNYLAGF